mgnify:CR=1 FL=1
MRLLVFHPGFAFLIFSLPATLAAQTTSDDFVRRGFARERQRDYDGAIADFTKAIELDSRSFDAFTARGALRRAKGDVAGATADYDRALAANPNHILALNNRGNLRRDRGGLDGAMADLNRAIAIKPDYANALANRGVTAAARGDFKAALADYDRAIDANPDHRAAYINRGNTRTALGDFGGAIDDFDHELQINPTAGPAFAGRGVARVGLGDYSGAAGDLDRAIDLAKDDAAYLRLLRCVILRRLHRDDRQSELILAMTTWPNGWLRSVGRFLTGDLSEPDLLAAVGTTDTRSSRGRRCEACYFAGMLRLLRGEPGAARELFARSVATGEAGFSELALARAEFARLPASR